MRRFTTTSLLCLLLAWPAWLPAQQAVSVPSTPPAAIVTPIDQPAPRPPYVLRPFTAAYRVLQGDRHLGDATLQVVDKGGGQWRIDLTLRGSGVLRLAGLNAEQSTVFASDGRQFRPLSQATRKRIGFSTRQTTGTYDWNRNIASWTGDLKPHRRAPVALQPGDLNHLLVDLAVIRDADAGRTLQYRTVDEGRAVEQVYQVSQSTETIQVGDIAYDALRVERQRAGSDRTVFWVAMNVPTPIRMQQFEDGRPGLDLQLIQYNEPRQ